MKPQQDKAQGMWGQNKERVTKQNGFTFSCCALKWLDHLNISSDFAPTTT
jgi:hypothetical protein